MSNTHRMIITVNKVIYAVDFTLGGTHTGISVIKVLEKEFTALLRGEILVVTIDVAIFRISDDKRILISVKPLTFTKEISKLFPRITPKILAEVTFNVLLIKLEESDLLTTLIGNTEKVRIRFHDIVASLN